MSKLGVRAPVQPAANQESGVRSQGSTNDRPLDALPPSPNSEDRLLRAFNELRDRLVSTLMFVLGNAEDAQDAAQEAFLKCWRSQDSLKDVTDLSAWIFRVGLNAAKDLRRSAWHRRAKPFVGGDAMLVQTTYDSPAHKMEYQESLQRLRQAIHGLPPNEKEVFLLRQNGDLTYEQIAEARQAPVGTVKTQMRSAIQKLRQVLA